MLYDVMVVGGGLSGLLTAHLLSKKGYSVALCEAQEKLGGRFRVDHPQGIPIEHSIALNLMTPEHSKQIGLDTNWVEIFDAAPLVFEKMNWRQAELEELSSEQKFFYLRQYVVPEGGAEKILKTLSQGVNIELSSLVTSCLHDSSLLTQMSSSKKQWEAKAFVMALPWTALTHLIGTKEFSPHFLKQIRKQKMISAIKLDFILNAKISDFKNILFSIDNNGLGFFPSNVSGILDGQQKQVSQWMFFLTGDELQDPEEVAKKIRAGKRFIRKVFPTFFDHIGWERIGVVDNAFQQFPLSMPDGPEWTTLKNLFWVGDCAGGPATLGQELVHKVLGEIEKIEIFLKGSAL